MKKLKEKEPFYASVYKHNVLKNNKSVKINKYTLGIELEVCYLLKKNFFNFKKKISKNNINKFISYIAPCMDDVVAGIYSLIIIMIYKIILFLNA